jgi:hypothetical protein
MDIYITGMLIALVCIAVFILIPRDKKKIGDHDPEPDSVNMREAVENWEKRQAQEKAKHWDRTVEEREKREDGWAEWSAPPVQTAAPHTLSSPPLTGGAFPGPSTIGAIMPEPVKSAPLDSGLSFPIDRKVTEAFFPTIDPLPEIKLPLKLKKLQRAKPAKKGVKKKR